MMVMAEERLVAPMMVRGGGGGVCGGGVAYLAILNALNLKAHATALQRALCKVLITGRKRGNSPKWPLALVLQSEATRALRRKMILKGWNLAPP